MLKTAYLSSCRDDHNCQRRDSDLDPLSPQSDALTTRLSRVYVRVVCIQLWFKNHRAKMKRQRDACMAAAAAAAAAAAPSTTNGGAVGPAREDELGKAEHLYRHGGEPAAPPPAGGAAFQKGDGPTVDVAAAQPRRHDGALFPAGRCSFPAEDRPSRVGGGYFDQSQSGAAGGGSGGGGGGGSALDELVLRLRSGPLGRLPESTAAIQPTAASCDN